MSFSHIFTIVVPVFLVIALGYGAGRGQSFAGERGGALTVLTMQFALPASLFLSIMNTPRHTLLSQGPLVGMLALGLLGLYALILLGLRTIGRLPLDRAAIVALASVQPQYAFMGVTILGNLFGGATAAIPIAIAGILVNVVLDPAVLILISLDRGGDKARTAAVPRPRVAAHAPGLLPATAGAPVGSGAGGGFGPPDIAGPDATDPDAAEKPHGPDTGPAGAGARKPTWLRIVQPLRKPFAWAPLLGLVFALVGIHPPGMVESSLTLVGQAASGVALLSVGVTLARVGRPQLSAGAFAVALCSVVVLPLSTYGIGLLLTSQQVAAQAALIVAFPVSPVPMMLASQHVKSEEHRIASAVIISIVLAFVTLPLMINLTN
ncbi:AEC family transporter [Streptomyces sp. NRRL F-5135]|uniref:AEC family transporter n=1 Tax=Streptomyces sp. NRRL F-5135 TaxID=1463858 RepID=UPI0004C4967C|nr:AEC family transporter [Streptomyces sp. NRRL F-5135]